MGKCLGSIDKLALLGGSGSLQKKVHVPALLLGRRFADTERRPLSSIPVFPTQLYVLSGNGRDWGVFTAAGIGQLDLYGELSSGVRKSVACQVQRVAKFRSFSEWKELLCRIHSGVIGQDEINRHILLFELGFDTELPDQWDVLTTHHARSGFVTSRQRIQQAAANPEARETLHRDRIGLREIDKDYMAAPGESFRLIHLWGYRRPPHRVIEIRARFREFRAGFRQLSRFRGGKRNRLTEFPLDRPVIRKRGQTLVHEESQAKLIPLRPTRAQRHSDTYAVGKKLS